MKIKPNIAIKPLPIDVKVALLSVSIKLAPCKTKILKIRKDIVKNIVTNAKSPAYHSN
jgi:hypothetical protein